jgi:hypothetical protein
MATFHLWSTSGNCAGATGTDLTDAKFEKFEDQSTSTQAPTTEVAALTIRQAKAGLAKTYDVDVDAIEIVIRG